MHGNFISLLKGSHTQAWFLSNVKMDGILATLNFIGFNCTLQLPKNLVVEGSHIRAPPFYPFTADSIVSVVFGYSGWLACLFSVLSFR